MNKLKLDVIIGSYYESKAGADDQGNAAAIQWLREDGLQLVSCSRPDRSLFYGSQAFCYYFWMTLMCGCVGLVLSSWLELCDPRFWSQEGNPGGTEPWLQASAQKWRSAPTFALTWPNMICPWPWKNGKCRLAVGCYCIYPQSLFFCYRGERRIR